MSGVGEQWSDLYYFNPRGFLVCLSLIAKNNGLLTLDVCFLFPAACQLRFASSPKAARPLLKQSAPPLPNCMTADSLFALPSP